MTLSDLDQLGTGPFKAKGSVRSIQHTYPNNIIAIKDEATMSKRELIDCICEINQTAKPEFLANFSEVELNEYLEHLMELDLKELAVCD